MDRHNQSTIISPAFAINNIIKPARGKAFPTYWQVAIKINPRGLIFMVAQKLGNPSFGIPLIMLLLKTGEMSCLIMTMTIHANGLISKMTFYKTIEL